MIFTADLVTQDQGRYHPGSDGARGLFHGQENYSRHLQDSPEFFGIGAGLPRKRP